MEQVHGSMEYRRRALRQQIENDSYYALLLTCTLTSWLLSKGTRKGTTPQLITICICSLPPSVKYDSAQTVSTRICEKLDTRDCISKTSIDLIGEAQA